jgi:hypothetical protein
MGWLRSSRPSNPAEAQAVLDRHVADVIERGYEGLRAIEGDVVSTHLGGLIRTMDGDGSVLAEVTAPSGALYNLVTSAWGNRDGSLEVEVRLQEDAEPYGQLSTQFTMKPDGTVSDVY